MANFFTKPLDQLTPSDIESLIDVPEGQVFEIKSRLSTERELQGRGNDNADPWYSGPGDKGKRSGPTPHAYRAIFRELVAFANADGGSLVLGLSETDERPKRVAGTEPIPACHELAERFRRAAADWVEPPLQSFQCVGIELTPDGCGVVVFRLPQSATAPHAVHHRGRHQVTKRVADESKAMNMREINDMVLERSHAAGRLSETLDLRRTQYAEVWPPPELTSRRIPGFQIVAAPAAQPISIDQPYQQANLFERQDFLAVTIASGSAPLELRAIDAYPRRTTSPPRPMLRGGQRNWTLTNPDFGSTQSINGVVVGLSIMSDGSLALSAKSSHRDKHCLFVAEILVEVANLLRMIDKIRILAGVGDADYAMEIDIHYDDHNLDFSLSPVRGQFGLGMLQTDDPAHAVPYTALSLPRYSIGPASDFPSILWQVTEDLYNSVGRAMPDGFSFAMPID